VKGTRGRGGWERGREREGEASGAPPVADTEPERAGETWAEQHHIGPTILDARQNIQARKSAYFCYDTQALLHRVILSPA